MFEQLINENGKVSARELHSLVGGTYRFSQWWKRNLSYGYKEGIDFTSVNKFTVVNNGAKKPIQDYEMELDMAKEVAMVQKNEIGQQVRKYFIACEKGYREELQNRNKIHSDLTYAPSYIGDKKEIDKWCVKQGYLTFNREGRIKDCNPLFVVAVLGGRNYRLTDAAVIMYKSQFTKCKQGKLFGGI